MHSLRTLVLTGLIWLVAATLPARAEFTEINGTVNWSEADVIPADALITVRMVDVSSKQKGGLTLGSVTLRPRQTGPIPFRLLYDDSLIEDRGVYRMVGTATLGDLVLMESLRGAPILDIASEGEPEVLLSRIEIASDEEGQSPVGRSWRALSVLGGEIARPGRVELTLGEDGIASGNSGCNRFSGRYDASPQVLDFSRLTRTKRGCTSQLMQLERRIMGAFKQVRSWRISEGRLFLIDAAGGAVMEFEEF